MLLQGSFVVFLSLLCALQAASTRQPSRKRVAIHDDVCAKCHPGAPLPNRSTEFIQQLMTTLCGDSATVVSGRQPYDAFVAQMFQALRNSSYISGNKLAVPRMLADRGGLWLEFGVFRGHTINYLALAYNGTVVGFDSFKGLPEQWRPAIGALKGATQKGSFNLNGRLPKVKANVRLIKGLFEDTLPRFVQQLNHSRYVSLLHVDCDLYSSSKTVLKHVGPLLRPGSVVVFDELIHYVEYRNHELKALYELLAESGAQVEVLGFSGTHVQSDPEGEMQPQSVAVRLCSSYKPP